MAEYSRISRRSLFAGIGLAAVAGIAAKFSAKSPAPDLLDKADDPAKDPEGDSYRLTEHIKKYYRSTTI